MTDTWSIACFYIQRRYRNQGMQALLLDGAIDYAKRNGARRIEAYPVDADSPSYRFMGLVGFFRRNGFEFVGEAGSRRKIHVREII